MSEQAARKTVLDFFDAETQAQAEKRLYKYTSCGAWIEFEPDCIRLGSIVEGCDFGTAIYVLWYRDNFTSKDMQDRIDAIEREADSLWDWANVLHDKNGRKHWRGKTAADRGCDAPDISYEYSQFEQDGISA